MKRTIVSNMEYKPWMDYESYKYHKAFMENLGRIQADLDIAYMKLNIEVEKLRRKNGNTNSNKQEEVLSTVSGVTENNRKVEEVDIKRIGCTCRSNVREQRLEECTCRTQS